MRKQKSLACLPQLTNGRVRLVLPEITFKVNGLKNNIVRGQMFFLKHFYVPQAGLNTLSRQEWPNLLIPYGTHPGPGLQLRTTHLLF